MTEVHGMTFRNLVKLQNDAKASFDRILSSHAMLYSCKFEVPDKICKMHSTTLRNTEYRVQIALGTSQRHYKYSTSSPIHGTDQGLDSYETHWVFISVHMRSTLKKENNSCTIISPD